MTAECLVSPAEEAEFSIQEFLAREQSKDLLRFTTAGSVDDGKSTLIGRLLYDSRNIYEDHVRAVTRTDGTGGSAAIDFAQLTDGLRAEREQGITIDVAYRYFSTANRKFIIADTPGHEQYTRNMATGASTADLAIILIDARKGLLTQSKRHSYIASLLGIPQVVAAINKMDLVDYSEDVYKELRAGFEDLAARLHIPSFTVIPISALEGDNVVVRSERTPWYTGPSLLEYLETAPARHQAAGGGFRMPVQRVLRPDHTFRGFAGRVAGGVIRPGDEIVALPSGQTSRVKSIYTYDGDLAQAAAPLSVTLTLEDEIDISRGDLIASVAGAPVSAQHLEASIVWFDQRPLSLDREYLLKHTSQTIKAQIKSLPHRVNVQTLEEEPASSLAMNGIGVAEIETSRPIFLDAYQQNRITGSFILIDPVTNATVAAGMVRRTLAGGGKSFAESARHTHRAALLAIENRPALAEALEAALLVEGCAVVRTRVTDSSVWRSLLHAGVIVIIERDASAQAGSTVRIATLETQLAFESAGGPDAGAPSIVESLRQRGILPQRSGERILS